jgi:hypothetical protein
MFISNEAGGGSTEMIVRARELDRADRESVDEMPLAVSA